MRNLLAQAALPAARRHGQGSENSRIVPEPGAGCSGEQPSPCLPTAVSSVQACQEGRKRDAWRRFPFLIRTLIPSIEADLLASLNLHSLCRGWISEASHRRVRASTYGYQGFPSGEQVENPRAAAGTGDVGSAPGSAGPWRRWPVSQHSCLESPEQKTAG